jgi:NTP pyrophosphatase (non-canonical NTP hydrolase)
MKLNKEDINKIFNHFGYDAQVKKLNEEFFEVTEALVLKNREMVVEEIADVLVVLEGIKEHYKISDVELLEVAESKVDRTIRKVDKSRKHLLKE